MTDKRFWWNGTSDGIGSIMDNETGDYLSYSKCISLLNELNDENEYWKHRTSQLLWILTKFDEEKVKELLKELDEWEFNIELEKIANKPLGQCRCFIDPIMKEDSE